MLIKFGVVCICNVKMEMVYCLLVELGVLIIFSLLKNLVLDIDYNDVVVVIYISFGAVQLIVCLLDLLGKVEGILGIIVGDDIIFIIFVNGFIVKDLYEVILELFDQEF